MRSESEKTDIGNYFLLILANKDSLRSGIKT